MSDNLTSNKHLNRLRERFDTARAGKWIWTYANTESLFNEAFRLQQRVADLEGMVERRDRRVAVLLRQIPRDAEPPTEDRKDAERWRYLCSLTTLDWLRLSHIADEEIDAAIDDMRLASTKDESLPEIERLGTVTMKCKPATKLEPLPPDETDVAPELCGHDDGSHCDESCAEKVRKYKEWMAANARTNGYDPNEIF